MCVLQGKYLYSREVSVSKEKRSRSQKIYSFFLGVNMADQGETNEGVNVKLMIENRTNIIEALSYSPSKVFDEVKAKGVLNREDYHRVLAQECDEEKIRKCLDIMEGKGEESAKIFLKILSNLPDTYPRLGPWIKDDGGREEESVQEADRILQDLPDEDLPFFLQIEKSSLSEELRKDFPRLCDAVREARLSPKFELKEFEEFKNNKSQNQVIVLLDLIMEEGAESFRSFCKILLQDERMKVPMKKSINKLETGEIKNQLRDWILRTMLGEFLEVFVEGVAEVEGVVIVEDTEGIE
uniref:CARD domain-containing protein n=1 Tax=Eptatretus burgeri TaxID=7764 RepID=A0A8C4R5Q4_EPTBU